MKNKNSTVFLYSGLTLLLIAFVIRYGEIGASFYLFWIVLGAAVLLKATFLFQFFRTKKVKTPQWLYLILAGVGMIFISMIFKYIYPSPWWWSLFFYGAITCKLTGLVWMLVCKKNE